MVILRYFATLRVRIGHGEERCPLPDDVHTPADIIAWLSQRGDNYRQAFAEIRSIKVAVDCHYVALNARLDRPREIAFFPPVTGG